MDQRSDAGLDPKAARLRLALAARAEADSLRARRAERLARIRAGTGQATEAADYRARGEPMAGSPARPEWDAEDEPERDVEALERFLAGLVGTVDIEPAPPQPARATRLAPVLPLVRPFGGGDDPYLLGAGADLAGLPGAGPGLVGALVRGGVPDLAALAGLGPEALARKLGPLGRLVDLEGWLAFARAAAVPSAGPGPAVAPGPGIAPRSAPARDLAG